jgi:serine/threonine-protein kinase
VEPQTDSDDLIGEVIASRYRIEARVGDGAMGTVYRARHVKVGRPFAVKVLRQSLLGNESIRRRFRREAELAGGLRHPNIVGMVDIGETSTGLCYLVMEYAVGDTLYDLIVRAAPLPAARVIPIVRQLCDGLAHAHDHGLIHRDFKPENVIVERDPAGGDCLKIIDFGIAILNDEAASSSPERLTTAGLVLGTPHYMAPEQALGQPIDHRVDLFALGVMCFEMLTGRAPFDGDGVDIALANVTAETPPMRDRAPDHAVDPLLEAFTRKLMMKSRDERPDSAADARALIDLIAFNRPLAATALGVAPAGTVASRIVPAATVPSTAALIAAPTAPIAPRAALNGPRITPNAVPLAVGPASSQPVPGVPAPVGPASSQPVPGVLAVVPSGTPPPRDTTELVMPVEPRRSTMTIAGIAALATIMVIAALVVVARRTRSAPDHPTAPAPAEVQSQDDAPVREAAPVVRAAVPGAAQTAAVQASVPPPRVITRSPAPRTVARWADRAASHDSHAAEPAREPAPQPQPPAQQIAEPVAPVAAPLAPPPLLPPPPSVKSPASPASPATVAELYALVGRKLKALDQSRGSAATADLWVVYLRIRINDVIADATKCAEADAVLHHLYDEVISRAEVRPDTPGSSPGVGR